MCQGLPTALIFQASPAGCSTFPTLRGLLWVHRADPSPTLYEQNKTISSCENSVSALVRRVKR